MKHYLNTNTIEQTNKATIALQWHRRGDGVRVNIENDSDFNEKEIFIPGAHVETKKEKTDRENYEHCKYIAYYLDRYANGEMVQCPECGEILDISGQTIGDKYKCPECGEIVDYFDLEVLSFWDYFESSIFDLEYRVGSDRNYRSVRVMVACGGPNIYIDTKTGDVELYWWTDSARYPISRYAIEQLDIYFEELFNC